MMTRGKAAMSTAAMRMKERARTARPDRDLSERHVHADA